VSFASQTVTYSFTWTAKTATGRATVSAGDTLQSIAETLWGDSSLWYLLAEANGLGDGF